MFIHIGNEYSIRLRDVVAIMDLDTSTIAKQTREFLDKAQKKGIVESITDDIPKTFVITNKKVYLTNISSTTLRKRVGVLA